MKYLKVHESFFNSTSPLEKEVINICRQYNIKLPKNWSVEKDGLVDVEGNIDMSKRNLKQIPIKFGRVNGNFDCSKNNLITLENGPIYLKGDLLCMNNKLTNFVGIPKIIEGNFNASDNNIKDFKGLQRVNGRSTFTNNPILNILKMVNPDKRVKFVQLLIEYKAIRDDGDTIIWDRLEVALEEVGGKIFNTYNIR